MYSTCLHCNADLGANGVLETLPIGRRIAFDAAQGRLWVICRRCGKWNLVPFDTRLESIDACEQLYRDTVTRYSTGTIGLAKVREGLELVRIGTALRPEFAAWRYGESYRKRRRRTYAAGGLGVGLVGAGLLGIGAAGVSFGAMTYMVFKALEGGWKRGVRRQAAFKVADPERDHGVLRLQYRQVRAATLVWRDEAPVLEVPRPYLVGDADRPVVWEGSDVRAVGRKVAGGLNALLGSRAHLADATALLATHQGDLTRWLRARAEGTETAPRAIEEQKRLSYWRDYTEPVLVPKLLPDVERLALEMWLNEDIERTWLEGELKLLEREWREAERIAKIADDLVLREAGPET